jgi:AcrR family transcriptional regulator
MSSRSDAPASNIARRRATARSSKKANYTERRREIAAAAAKVFKERGFSRTTLSHIAEAMGADRASLYYYVGSKEELFEDIVSEVVKVNLATAAEIKEQDSSAPEKLRQLVESLTQSYEDHYPVLYVLIQENLSHVAPERSQWAEEMKRINRDYERVVIEIIEEGQRDGSIRSQAPAWLLAYGIIGMVGWTNRWFNPNESPVDAATIGTAFADTILGGIATRRPASPRRTAG